MGREADNNPTAKIHLITDHIPNEAERAAEQTRLARELAKSANLLDRFRRPILLGCGYTVNFAQPMVYSVTDVLPVLNRPDLPRGSFRVKLQSELTLILNNGVPTEELALCAMPPDVQQDLMEKRGVPIAPPPTTPPAAPPETDPVPPDAPAPSPAPGDSDGRS